MPDAGRVYMPRKVSVENIAKRKEQIVRAAITAFARTGLKETSMDDIVRESGLSKGAIYWYYKSKDEIISELVNVFFDPNELKMLDRLLSTGSATERIKKLIDYTAEAMDKMKPFQPVIQELYVIAFRNPKIKKMATKDFQESTTLFAKVIEYGVKHKEFKRVDPQKVSVSIMEMMEGAAMLWFINPRGFDYVAHVRYGINLIIDAIKVNK